MPFDVVRQESAQRLLEAQIIMTDLRRIDQEEIQHRDETAYSIRKGLFIVLLYAAFEYCVNRLVLEVGSEIGASGVTNNQLCKEFYALALDPQFKSVAAQGKATKWDKRQSLIVELKSERSAVIHSSSLLSELGNVWASSLKQLFSAFGITSSHLHSPSAGQYIDEVVDNRNKIAHGRESASTVGRSYTLTMLQVRLDQLEMQKEYLISTFENIVDLKLYVDEEFRDGFGAS